MPGLSQNDCLEYGCWKGTLNSNQPSVWNVPHAARWKYRTQKLRKNRHFRNMAQLCPAMSSQLRYVSTIGKKVVKQQYLLLLLLVLLLVLLLLMEFGQITLRYPAIQLASCLQTWFPTCCRQVRAISTCRDSSNLVADRFAAGSRAARELDSAW